MNQLRSVRLTLTARPAWAASSASTPRMERTRPSKVRPSPSDPAGRLVLLMLETESRRLRPPRDESSGRHDRLVSIDGQFGKPHDARPPSFQESHPPGVFSAGVMM